MAVQIQFRGGTAAEWEEANPVLAEREMGIETDTLQLKFGDGVTAWNDLEYGGIAGPQGERGPAGNNGTNGTNGTNGQDGVDGDWSTAQTLTSRNTDFSISASDVGKFLTVDSDVTVTCTISDSLGILNGQRIDIGQVGEGQINFVTDGTVIWATPTATTRAQYSVASIVYMGIETYWIMGDLAAE